MTPLPSMVVNTIRANARLGTTTGQGQPSSDQLAYERHCSYMHWHTGSMVDFTRVVPPPRPNETPRFFDLRRYLGMAVSFRMPHRAQDPGLLGATVNLSRIGIVVREAEFDLALAMQWAESLFSPWERMAWRQPDAFTETGEVVSHWRLFCDPQWQPVRQIPQDYLAGLALHGWRTLAQIQTEGVI